MSVINQMLRDLEQRKVKDSGSEQYVDEVNIIAKSKMNPLWLILAIIIMLTIGINLYLHSHNQTNLTQNLTPNLRPLENESVISDSELITLPQNIYEINQKMDTPIPIDDVQTTERPGIQELSRPALEDEAKPKEPKPKEPKQPSVKIETYVKNESKKEAKAKVNNVKKSGTQLKKVKSVPIHGEINEKKIAENKSFDSKTTVKSPVKSIPTKITSQEVVYQAGQLMATNQSAAIQLLKDKIKLVSPDADYYSLMANLQQRRNEYDEAIISYRKALEIAPDKGELWIGIALAYRATGEESNAKKAFKEALTSIEISPELKRYAEKQL